MAEKIVRMVRTFPPKMRSIIAIALIGVATAFSQAKNILVTGAGGKTGQL